MSESSPENDSVLVAPETITDVDTAQSSSAADQGVEKSPADLVFEALGMDQEKSPVSEQGPDDPVDPKTADAATAADAASKPELGEITDEELKKYGPKTQARIQQLLDQRLEKHTELEALRPKAQQFEQLEEFATSNKLSMTQVAEGVELVALANTRPEAALEKLLPIVQHLMQVTGRVLPDEIKERVRLGYIGEEEAQRLVRSEAAAKRASQQLQQTEEERQAEQEAGQIRELQRTAQSTAETWEANRKRSDPDWQSKQGRVGELIKLEVYEKGFPKTKDAIVKMLDGIADKVTAEYSQFAPRLKEVRSITGTVSTKSSSEPKSSQEAALKALGFDL